MQQPESASKTESSPADGAPRPVDDHGAGHMPVHAKPGTGLRLIPVVVALAIALAIGYFIVSERKGEAEAALSKSSATDSAAPPAVDVVQVEFSAPSHDINLPGESRAWYESTIYARISGYLKKWNVDIGDRVHAGDVLAIVETPELDQQLAADVAKVEADKAQIKLAQARVHFSEVTLARYKDAPKGVVSDVERDEKEANYQTDLARQTAAGSDLNSTQADVDRLRAMIAFKQVTAPFDGTITQRHIDIGDLVTAGSTANTTSLFTIAQFDTIRVFVDVPQSMATLIHDGDSATADTRDIPGHIFSGKVARNSRSISQASKTLRVEVDIPNKDLTLLPGMYLEVHFHVSDANPLLRIPAGAIAFRSSGPAVAIVAPDGRVTFAPVDIARDLGDFLEIRAGLKPDSRVAMNISNQIANGDVVTARTIEIPGMAAPAPHLTAAANTIQTSTNSH